MRAVLGQRQRGQAFVELALVLLFLTTLLVGAADFGRVFYLDVVATSAAMEGARAAAAGLPDADVIAAVVASAPGGLIQASNVTVTPPQGMRATLISPQWTTVTVTYTFAPLTPLAGSLVGHQRTITRSASQRMRTPCALADGTACS